MLLSWVSHVVLVSFFCFSVDQLINWHNISFAILGIDFFLHTSLSYIVIDVILHASKPQFRRDHIVVVRPFQKNGECHCERVLDFAICFCFAAVLSVPVNTARGVLSFGKKNGIRDVSFVFHARSTVSLGFGLHCFSVAGGIKDVGWSYTTFTRREMNCFAVVLTT